MKKRKPYITSLFFLGIIFLFTFYINLGYEDTSFGVLGFFLISGLAFIFEGIKRLRQKKEKVEENQTKN